MNLSNLLHGWNIFQQNSDFYWVSQLFDYLGPILYAIMAVVGAAGAVYAIVLGVNLAKAEDQSKRDEAKKRIITTIISIAVVVALVIFFNELLPLIVSAVATPGELPDNTGTQGDQGGQILLSLLK